MTYTIDISKQAQTDLRGIYEYIAFTKQSPQNAAEQLDRLGKNILSLYRMPMRFRKYESEPWLSRGMRIMPVDNFLVLYIPNTKTKVVTIIRVMYNGRDLDAQLDEHTDF